MRAPVSTVPFLVLGLLGCGSREASAPPAPSTDPPVVRESAPSPPPPVAPTAPPTRVPELPPGRDPVLAMYDTVDALYARPEHDARRVVVQHCLIGIGPKYGGRGPAEAEREVARLLGELAGGTPFEEIVREHTNDTFPGIYTLLKSGQPDRAKKIFLRADMAKAFGDAAWRLQPGEVGVVPYDPAPLVAPGGGTSPFGFHIVKRLQ